MKKFFRLTVSALCILTLSLSLCACGSKYSASGATTAASSWYEESAYDSDIYIENGALVETEAVSAPGFANAENGERNPSTNAKIIYTANAELETTDFETALHSIQELVDKLGGYMESSSISDNSYYSKSHGYASSRSASYTIRIPSESFFSLTDSLSDIGNVPYCNTSSRNITEQYYDTQSRLNAYRTQETRLLEMLSAAETVEDMLAIQNQLTQVQYEIDSLSSTLRYYDSQVSYSTVNLSVQEVAEYTPQTPVKQSYGEKLTEAVKSSLKDIGSFFSGLGIWLVSALPVLILLAVFGLVVFLIIRSIVQNAPKRRAKRNARKAAKALRVSDTVSVTADANTTEK